nr:asparaginase [Pseudomonas quercus]
MVHLVAVYRLTGCPLEVGKISDGCYLINGHLYNYGGWISLRHHNNALLTGGVHSFQDPVMLSPAHTPIVVATRNTHVERIHWGSIAVVDATGAPVVHVGDPDTYVFSRSTLKPFQAIPLVRDGGHHQFGFSTAELAIICGSHSGEDFHVIAVTRLLEKISKSEPDLRCGCHLPIRYGEHNLPPFGSTFDQRYNNCSGKHAGFLGYCSLHGYNQNYLDPDHPLQVNIREEVAMLANLPKNQLWSGIDGCSAPNYGMPLSRLALLWARLATSESGIDRDHDNALSSIASAMVCHPEMVSGTGRCDQAIALASDGDCIAKVGADGVYTIGIRSRGLGIAIKIADGNLGALYTTAVNVLVQLGLIDEHKLLTPWVEPTVVSMAGECVGKLQTRLKLPNL